jgi:hypothetical protein
VKALNPVMPKGMPLAGSYGPNAARRDTVPATPGFFGLTPAADDETPEAVYVEVPVVCSNCAEAGEPGAVHEEVQEVTDDGGSEFAGDEVA